MIRRILPKGRTPHICVVGAGMAGMRCAQVLSDKGMKVTVFEGRDRLGGRMQQSNHLGQWVDLQDLLPNLCRYIFLTKTRGPNWIHGTDHNPFIDLAKETDTTTFSVPEKSALFDEFGHPLPEDKAAQYSEVVWGMISDAFKYSNEHSASIPQTRSLRDYLEESVKDKGLTKAEERIVLQMAEMWGAFVGDPLERQSLKFFWLEECIEGENLFVASTYRFILSHIATTALANTTVHLSTKVTTIESIPPSLPTSPNPSVRITTSTGTTHTFDEVIMTAPLGYLKRNLSTFVPPLPPRLTSAIANISYGRLEKVYITFPHAFWDFPSSSSTPSTHPFFTHFLPPTYTPTNPSHWNIEAVSFSALPPPSAHPTLLFYIHGPCASHVVSLTKNLPPHSPLYRARLLEFFEPYYARLPGYVKGAAGCVPQRVLATRWQEDEFAGWGSYANFQVAKGEGDGEGQRLDRDIEALRGGVPERGVWFAGEHTAPFVALGTVTGAWWSGEEVGGRVAGGWVGGEGGEGGDGGERGVGRERDGVEGGVGVVKGVKGKMEAGEGADGGRLNGVAL